MGEKLPTTVHSTYLVCWSLIQPISEMSIGPVVSLQSTHITIRARFDREGKIKGSFMRLVLWPPLAVSPLMPDPLHLLSFYL